jgi:uncharacterized protein (TIGR00369 family)
MDLRIDNYCFACGKENPVGLKMEFQFGSGELRVPFVPSKEHQGWRDVVHGGILFTLLDEAMAWVIMHEGPFVMTSKMEIKFLRPAMVGEELLVYAKLEKSDERYFYTSSKITNKAGKIVAAAKGTYVKVAGEGGQPG